MIAQLPDSGWPAGLFARRDAVILTLVAAGLTYTQIAALRICDVTVDPVADALHIDMIGGARAVTPHSLVQAGAHPPRIRRRWMEVLGFSNRYFSTNLLAACMEGDDGDELAGQDAHVDSADRRPLLTPIDQWGHTPVTATALTPRAIADITSAHLSGRAPRHSRSPARPDRADIPGIGQSADTVLLGDYYEHGIVARKHAHESLADVPSVLDEVEERADRLLADLLELIDGTW